MATIIDYETSKNLSHGIEVLGFNSRPVGSTDPLHTIHVKVTDNDKWYYEKGYQKQVSRKLVRKDGIVYYRLGGYKYDVTDLVAPFN